jgi:glutamate-1-semialdehyde 2,1-aminomutase
MALTDTKNPTAVSDALWARAQKVIPGGVNSPVRAFKSVGGTPRFIERGEGPWLFDVDGHRYLDFCNSWGPLILGHAYPEVARAVEHAVRDGMSFGAPTEAEVLLAERIVSMVPFTEQVRMVSSGTEAVMSAVRLARGVTGRSKIVKFAGCYHGHADYLLVSAGSGLATFGTPDSGGVPDEFARCTLVAPLDDEEAVRGLFAEHGADIAAAIIEGVPANNGLLLQRSEYLTFLRDITREHGALLIFDEVITGFRLGPDGAAGRFEIEPDLVTYGKVIGGGMPVGAYAGPRKYMEHLAPLGPVYQAGTLSGNPVAMTAGLATLDVLTEHDGWTRLEELGRLWDDEVGSYLQKRDLGYVRIGSIFWICFQKPPVPRTAEAIDSAGAPIYARFHAELLARGVYFAPSAYEVGFLSLVQNEDLLQATAGAVRDAVDIALKGASA